MKPVVESELVSLHRPPTRPGRLQRELIRAFNYCVIGHSLSTQRRAYVSPSGYETYKHGSLRTYQIRRLQAEDAAADVQFQIARPEPSKNLNDALTTAGVD